MSKPAPGSVNANRRTVFDYLTHYYGGRLPASEAENLVRKYAAEVKAGERVYSFANYVGGKILRAEGLPEYDHEFPDEDDDE